MTIQKQELDSNHKKFLKSTFYIDKSKSNLKNKVQELINGIYIQNKTEIAIKLFYFVRDEIKYVVKFTPSYYYPKNLKASETLDRAYGYCIQKAVLMAALARIAGIPSRIHFVDMVNFLTPQSFIDKVGNNFFIYHAYPELFLNGKWVEANVAFDKELCTKKNFPLVDFDGINPGLFAKHDTNGQPFVKYYKDRGVFPDVPYWKIIWAWKKEYHFKWFEKKKK